MKYLCLDFGLKNLGLAIAETPLAEPLGQFHYQSEIKAVEFVLRQVNKHQIATIIIGLPEGQLMEKTKAFGKKLQNLTQLPVFYQDETLSTKEAQQKMLASELPQKKRRQDHVAAATHILQTYLDEHSST